MAVEKGAPIKASELLNTIYPIGSVYMSVNDVSPQTFMPDSVWVKIEGRFLIGANSSYPVTSAGGSTTHHHQLYFGFDEYNMYIAFTSNSDTLYGTGVTTNQSGRLLRARDTGVYDTTISTQPLRISYTGNGNTLPPYFAVYMWYRQS